MFDLFQTLAVLSGDCSEKIHQGDYLCLSSSLFFSMLLLFNIALLFLTSDLLVFPVVYCLHTVTLCVVREHLLFDMLLL